MTFDPALAIPILIGIGCVAYAAYESGRVRSARYWSQIPARVVRSRVVKLSEIVEGTEVPYFQPQVLYEYQYQGKNLRSVDLCLDEEAYRFTTWDRATAVLNNYPADQNVEIYISNNGRVVLLAEINWLRKSHYLAWFLFGVLIMLLTPLLLWVNQ